MQYEFKRKGFRKLNDDESDEDVRKRNAEIAHWSRAIMEVVYCWGSVMSHKQHLYHGINCKLLFHRFSQRFSMPTSLTTSVRVGQNFAQDGIILVLKHAGESDCQSLMFDVSLISDYPNEQERLMCRSYAQFSDILMDNRSVKQWIKALKIYERIFLGYLLSPISVKIQEMIVFMIDNYLEDKKGKNPENDEFYQHGNVPNYIQQVFDECTNTKSYFLVNSSAISSVITNEKLLLYLDDSQDGKKSEFFKVFLGLMISYVYEWRVTGDEYTSFFSASHPWIIDQQVYQINLAEGDDDEPMYFRFHWELQNDKNDGLLNCILRCDELPAKVEKLEINLGILIPKTKSEAYFGWYLNHQQMYAFVLHSIVDCQKLAANVLDIGKNEFDVKFQLAVTFVSYSS